ncbi:MAG: hypothetical protein M3270_00945 [Thermoproteota archaeon]|nr:hypothetical protein [Thermoproteota archaeon]
MSSSTNRQQENKSNNPYGERHHHQQQEYQATIRSIDKTKNNIHQAMQELRSETTRYSQAIADFHTQAVELTQEIAHNFLDSQRMLLVQFNQSGLL